MSAATAPLEPSIAVSELSELVVPDTVVTPGVAQVSVGLASVQVMPVGGGDVTELKVSVGDPSPP